MCVRESEREREKEREKEREFNMFLPRKSAFVGPCFSMKLSHCPRTSFLPFFEAGELSLSSVFLVR